MAVCLNGVAGIALAISWVLYALYGHEVVEAMYYRESIGFLNTIIEGQAIHPLQHYVQAADEMMGIISLLLVVGTALLTVLLKLSPPLSTFFERVLLLLWRSTTPVLAVFFLFFSLLTSALAFFYPLEIETRESTVWLAALAIKAGINIYDQSQVAFVNLNHGPFDPILKSAVAVSFPFLESWQVTRFPVLILPYLFLLLAWKVTPERTGFVRVVFLGSMGYLFLLVTAKEFLFVGRSDPTVAVLLLILLFVSCMPSTTMKWTTAFCGIANGLLASLVILTNWRTAPVAVAILLFAVWCLRVDRRVDRSRLEIYAASCVIASVTTFSLMLYHVSNLDLAAYYHHFFGFYSNAAGWTTGESFNGPVITFLTSLINPMARPESLKGGPLLLASVVCLLLLFRRPPSRSDMPWLILILFCFTTCSVAYYLNYWGGGSWYFIPFLTVLWFFFGTKYSDLSPAKLNLLGIFILALIAANFRTVVLPTVHRALTIREAGAMMAKVRSLQENSSVISEDTFFFRTRYAGELIDMGDTVSFFAKNGYFGAEFKQTVQRHFDGLRSNPPDYIVTGFTGSPELRALIADKYVLLAEGPANFTANGGGESKLFVRRDLRT